MLAGEDREALFLLEHEPVFTLGRNANAADVLAPAAWLETRGVEVHESSRGGQVTYHGPGQLVGYPIIDLNPDRRDVRRYVGDLESVLVRTLGEFGIEAEGRSGSEVGVWVGGSKIASIGVHLRKWVTLHGFALNVSTDLEHYQGIVACGLEGVRMISIERLLGSAPDLPELARRVAGHFADVFDRKVEWGEA